MCGRYSLNASASQVIEYYNLRYETDQIRREFREEKEVFPTRVEPVIQNLNGNRSLIHTHWGLKNVEVNGKILKKPIINATIEKIKSYWKWANALESNRCIIPATEYWEWSETIPKPNNRFRMSLENEEIFSFAGLNVPFKDDDGMQKIGFVIVTMPANKHVAQIHHRQPGLILKKDFESWLDDSSKDPEKIIYHAEGNEIQFVHEVQNMNKDILRINKKEKRDDNLKLF
ncbi:SOS response-associated peptidase [Leptospira barantonii]|uniref:Abasic site processing protein n=1 Tax=Leptospira barantonii TaxID=2023184 RepID=A0ABX4NPT5_9LEPT|nr:SOS response-associated peptidase family protein [Leptospira barantonii]PJZ58289.1 hypothetical protein CH367_07890 [Leptospira barantonii]